MEANASPWPSLPEGCPPEGAAPRRGTFYRLTNGSPRDWQNHVQIFGMDWCEERVSLEEGGMCTFHALSVYRTVVGAEQTRKRYRKKFEGHQVTAIAIDETMGLLREDNPDTTHNQWWPQTSEFVPEGAAPTLRQENS